MDNVVQKGVSSPPVAILFDADGVIQRSPEGSADMLAADLGVDDPDQVLRELSAAEESTVTGLIYLRDAIGEVLARRGRSEFIYGVLQCWFQIEVDRVVVDTIARLRTGGIRVYLATNQGVERGAYMRQTLGYGDLFDDQFYSCELGLAKPDPAYFLAILGRLALSPHEVLFLDDNEANVRSALSVGLRAQLYPRYQSASLSSILTANGITAHHESAPADDPALGAS